MKKDEMMKKDDEMMKKDDEMMKKEPASYQNYSESTVASALKSGKKVVLFFHASRCPNCRSLEKDINA
jgi:thiol-disulfide isomerase/thioredoxin